MSNKMNEIRELIAELAEEAKDICYSYGLKSVDKATIALRDSSNPNTWMLVSDDEACDVVWWRDPAKELPPIGEWVLVHVEKEDDLEREYFTTESMYEGDGIWYVDKSLGERVVAWMPLPKFNGDTR